VSHVTLAQGGCNSSQLYVFLPGIKANCRPLPALSFGLSLSTRCLIHTMCYSAHFAARSPLGTTRFEKASRCFDRTDCFWGSRDESP